MQQTITTTASPNTNAHRKALPAPPGNDQDRGNNFAGSLHLIAKLRARNSRPAAKLERLDEEDEYIDQTKQEIRCIKIQDIGAARNALRMAQQAFEAGTGTLSQLQLQGDRLKNAENNLDQAAFANKDGARKLKALETSKLAAGWQASKEKNIHKFTDIRRHRGATSKDILSRAKYQFEPDSDDEELEDVIEGTLDEIA
ncbi:hypothetical protein SNOG_02970 [Parastagonospora nodorum SN15]|uniref:Uncharacterized protein n=1 Tax=Phaeosphaeria nodorum (strain SN15 / ATCC MYA-4574 / FGSC 10173) TaxID=321614 RepID=Q0UZ44_PHANO|nr:hypothetical protein SNOG_02970 [Parastagonospora nodorum SN15]EAT89701.2 hypothetical protein SNOG_02970 [Parastagonospora nodorum SN15]